MVGAIAACSCLIPVARAEDSSTLTSLTVEQAREVIAAKPRVVLHELDGGFVSFDALTSLSPEVAEVLVAFEGQLSFKGLTELSPETAAALAEFSGELVLKAITELPPEAGAALAKHKGRLHLTGLTVISPETRAALQSHANVLLPRSLAASP